MKKLFILVLCLFTFTGTCFSEDKNDFNFRKTVWNMSQKDVEKSELPNKPEIKR